MLSKLYVREPNSPATAALRLRFEPPGALTDLHRLEIENAWRLKVFRRELTADEVTRAGADLQADLEAGVWSVPALDMASAFALGLRLCREHTGALGTRSLDVLHVATAVALGERNFVTADERQGKLAAAVGLRVTML